MGREIRKVKKCWEHPKDDRGSFQPMFDQTFESAFKEWQEGLQKWVSGNDPDAEKYNYPKTALGYTQWHGTSPDPEYYRKEEWTKEEANCFQMYETVSEGTPVSPVFETLEELANWLVDQGHSQKAANEFCANGSAPSMTISNGILRSGVDVYDAE